MYIKIALKQDVKYMFCKNFLCVLRSRGTGSSLQSKSNPDEGPSSLGIALVEELKSGNIFI
jgi:hypothetical protein